MPFIRFKHQLIFRLPSGEPDCPEGTTAVGNGCYAGVKKNQNKGLAPGFGGVMGKK